MNGTGGLSNTGSYQHQGSATVQATLNVANAAAGFGTKGVETGTVVLENDALLEFKSGQITTIDGELQLDGANARVADAGATQQQQRADRPYQRRGYFFLQNGATVTTDRQCERHRQRHGGARRALHRRLRGHQPDDRRER